MRTVTAPGTSPRRGPGAAPGTLALADAAALGVAAHSPTALDPDLRVFAGDLVRPYGFPLDEEQFAAGAGQSYAEMGEAVIDALVPPDRPVDLLIEVFTVPDVQPGRAASVHLSTYCPGRPFAFALSEQGTAGAFSALALAASYLAGEGFRRALILVLEQSALHYTPPPGTPVPDRHTAVGLLWEAAGDLRYTALDSTPRVAGRDAHTRVAKSLAALPPGGGEPLLLLGAGLAGFAGPPGTETVRARPGSPYTGLWSALARALPRVRDEHRTVLLADHDPLLGHLDLAVLRPA